MSCIWCELSLSYCQICHWTWSIWQWCICIAAVSSSFWVAAKGGLRGELLLLSDKLLIFPSPSSMNRTFCPWSALWWLWNHLLLLQLMLQGTKQQRCTGSFLALAPNVSANQFLITAESIVSTYFWIRKKKTDGKIESKYKIWCIVCS